MKMKPKTIFLIILIPVIIAIATIAAILISPRLTPHTTMVLNVVYNGKIISSENVEVDYFIGMHPKEDIHRLTLGKNGIYTVNEGVYGPQGFLTKINPKIFGNNKKKPVEISYSFYNTQNWHKQTINSIIQLEKTEDSTKYKGILIVASSQDQSFYYKKDFTIDLSDNASPSIQLENINNGP